LAGVLARARWRDCELWRLNRIQSIFGGTTEIMKEIIARSLGL
jgi:alkylation response protein AidB-like acyl-CoA dehydrogenase